MKIKNQKPKYKKTKTDSLYSRSCQLSVVTTWLDLALCKSKNKHCLTITGQIMSQGNDFENRQARKEKKKMNSLNPVCTCTWHLLYLVPVEITYFLGSWGNAIIIVKQTQRNCLWPGNPFETLVAEWSLQQDSPDLRWGVDRRLPWCSVFPTTQSHKFCVTVGLLMELITWNKYKPDKPCSDNSKTK